MSRLSPKLLVFALLALSGLPAGAQEPVTYDRMLQLLQLEVREEKLLTLLQSQPTVFTLSDGQIAKLRQSGATDRLLAAMQRKAAAVVESDTTAYVVILDASGSMLEALPDGQTKWDVAKHSAGELLASVPDGLALSVVVYGHVRERACGVEVLRPLAPLTSSDKQALIRRIAELQPVGKTPITSSLRTAREMLASFRGSAKILLITDGLETCGSDPAAEAQTFAESAESGRSVDVIGFGLNALEGAAVAKIAASGKGKYRDAKTSRELAVAFDQAKEEMLQKLQTTAGALKIPASKDLHAPAELPVGSYTQGRLAPGNSHYWRVEFPAGEYVVVYDVKTSNNAGAVIGSARLGFDKDGKFEGELSASVSVNEVRARNVIRVRFAKPTKKLIQVTNGPYMTNLEDYQLGVFRADEDFGVPFLVNRPQITPVELGRPTVSPLLGGAEFYADRYAFFRVKLPPGDFVLDVAWSGAEKDEFATLRHVDMFDLFGVNQKTLVTGQTEKSARVILQTADDSEMLLRVGAGAKKEKVTLTIRPKE